MSNGLSREQNDFLAAIEMEIKKALQKIALMDENPLEIDDNLKKYLVEHSRAVYVICFIFCENIRINQYVCVRVFYEFFSDVNRHINNEEDFFC